MSGSIETLEDGARARWRIAADPAFAALDASGAPILAAAGEPLRIVYLNESACAVFGADAAGLADRLFRSAEPGARRLAELVDSVRHGAALRLERLRFLLDSAPQTVTILCRKLASDDGACFVIAALGVRPAAAPVNGAADAAIGDEARGAAQALRGRLAARHGDRAPRFLWKTDAEGRFIDVTHTLADVVGDANADILGRAAAEVARAFALDPAFARAVASQKSWSGVEVDWPLDAPGARVPTTLGALPATDADRRFAGYQGYGVLHLDRARLDTALDAPAPEQLAPAGEVAFAAPNVVPLRPSPRMTDEDGRDDGHDDDAAQFAQDAEAELTSTERSAFDEIARALRAGPLVGDDKDQDNAPAAAEEAPIAPSLVAHAATLAHPDAVHSHAALALEGLLDRLPVGVLVARGAQTLFVNRTLLDYLGFADRAAFDADGGLARMFFGRPPANVGARPGPVAVQASDGEALDVDAHLQIVEWEGGPATLVTLRRNRLPPPRGPEESALALARTLEEKLARVREENALLRAAFEGGGEAVALVSDDGRIESASPAFAALLGVAPAALEGEKLTTFFGVDDARALAARLARARADSLERLRLLARARGAAAVSVEAALRRLPFGAARMLCVSLRDLSSSQRLTDDIEAARLAAEDASAAKSDFLARVSHEIRTPLNAILGFAEVMMEERFGPIGSERYKEYLKDVHASGALVLSLVNDLLDLSKIEAGKMELSFERVDANAIISECASMMQAQANQGRIVMRLALAPGLPLIRADARSLRQILLNLLSNAVKFNEPGGQVIVSSALTDAGSVAIRVKDTGIGMTDDEAQTALEPFKQIATARPSGAQPRGTGLGLPVTKALIEANHATFTIKSRKNEGTLIEIDFPPPQVLAAE